MTFQPKYCQYIVSVNPGGWEGALGSIAVDFSDPRYVCCGRIARFKLEDCDEWLCAEHYNIWHSKNEVQ